MDPNRLLAEIREIVTEVWKHEDSMPNELVELVEKVDALDGWLSIGGFLPDPWKYRVTGGSNG